MNFTNSNEYVWMLKNKSTGNIYSHYTYRTRESARKAVRAPSGRFAGYTPVKVFKSEFQRLTGTGKTKTTASKKRTTTTRTTTTTKSSKQRMWFPITDSRYIG